jgi:hypothetical protein
MAQHQPAQDDPGREIIEIDQEIHDLLMRRALLLAALRRDRNSACGDPRNPLKPGEDAATVRRIVAHHDSRFPLRAAVRIWREILMAGLSAQAQLGVHVYAGENALAFWDLARVYFGSTVPVTGHATASAVVHTCAEDPMACGVVPLPESAENVSPWWAQLAAAGEAGPRIIAKLPLVVNDGGRFDYPSAYAIGSIEQRPTGDDTSILFLETPQELSRTRLQALLKQVGIEARIVAAGQEAAKSTTRELLLETDGFVASADSRMAALVAAGGEALLRAAVVGGYANPLDYDAQGG